MAIDRTNFNALIDDDGSGTKGSVWNKSAIDQVVLTPVQNELDALGPIGVYADVPFSAINYGNMTVGAGNVITHSFAVTHKVMTLTVRLDNVTATGASSLVVLLPIGYVSTRSSIGAAFVFMPGVASEVGFVRLASDVFTDRVSVYRPSLAAFPAGPVSMWFTISIFLT